MRWSGLETKGQSSSLFRDMLRHKLFWVRVPGYFCQFSLEPPMARPENGGPPRVRGEVNSIGFDDKRDRDIVHSVLNSSTYYQFFCTYTDTRHINPSDVAEFPLDLTTLTTETKAKLKALSEKLGKCFAMHTTHWRKSGLLIDSIDSKLCKPILDEIDRALAGHYRFTDEEVGLHHQLRHQIPDGARRSSRRRGNKNRKLYQKLGRARRFGRETEAIFASFASQNFG